MWLSNCCTAEATYAHPGADRSWLRRSTWWLLNGGRNWWPQRISMNACDAAMVHRAEASFMILRLQIDIWRYS